ncbi:hypothetical protein [Chryseobacterium kwangjuense]|uniref:Transposase n=1 Tax=Chryseobacterium kwangjuense TaxID=267125 RepID=A0A135W053_9FLAO|nr:hypothetical protein [Chryseobacterium kwangjuense]KXH78310.1 transposase [Chryseobacterium kwangjuense]
MEKAPNYKRIYEDMLNLHYPHKLTECRPVLDKARLSIFDIHLLNTIIFGKKNKENQVFNQKLRSYNEEDIREVLRYQRQYNLNNTQTALHFKLSRNSIASWRKKYPILK